MPQLIFKGVTPDIVQKLSIALPKKLADLSDTPVDYLRWNVRKRNISVTVKSMICIP